MYHGLDPLDLTKRERPAPSLFLIGLAWGFRLRQAVSVNIARSCSVRPRPTTRPTKNAAAIGRGRTALIDTLARNPYFSRAILILKRRGWTVLHVPEMGKWLPGLDSNQRPFD